MWLIKVSIWALAFGFTQCTSWLNLEVLYGVLWRKIQACHCKKTRCISSRFGRLDAVTANTTYGTSTNYTYDNYDRITKKSQTNKAISAWGGTKPTLDASYGYTVGGKLSTLTLPFGRQLSYTYSSTYKNQLTDIKLDNASLLRSITYNTGGMLTGWNWGAGNANYALTYAGEKDGFIYQVTNRNNSNAVNYYIRANRDSDGRISKITRNNGLVDTFTYTDADRLATETRANGTTNVFGITYTYDANGNRLSLVATGTHQQPNASVNYTYSRNKLTHVNGSFRSYTNNAELIYGTTSHQQYDYAGNRRYSGKVNNYEYYMTYSHKNERTVRAYSNTNSNWQNGAVQFVYDEDSRLIGEYRANGTPITEYVWMGDKPVAAIYGSGATSKIYWIVTDAQNTPRRLIDAANGSTTVWAWDSNAFGVIPPSVQTVTFNLRFPGKYYDVLTKQHYNHHRYYSPELGRYMEPDPIGLEGGLNPYIYANSNPVRYTDSTGLLVTINGMYVNGVFDISNPDTYDNLTAVYNPAPTPFFHPSGYTDYGNSSASNSNQAFGVMSDVALGNVYGGATKQVGAQLEGQFSLGPFGIGG